MRTVSLSNPDSRSWERIHSVAWSFTQVHAAEDGDLKNADLIALVRTREADNALEKQLRQLEQHGNVVDLSDLKRAEDEIADLISH